MKYTIQLVDLKAQYRNIRKEINGAIRSVIRKTNFVMGDEIRIFESEFSKFNSSKFSLGLSSGTDAIHLALRALGVGQGDEVIVPSHSFTATAEAIVWLGAKPVFCDVDERTFTLDPKIIEKSITKKTKVIIPVHLYGRPAEMVRILNIAKKYRLKIIEDCAQAHGALYEGRKVGTMGDVGAFSFYPGKNLGAYGDAGMILTQNEKIYHMIQLLRNHGRTEKYIHEIIGYGNRMDTIQAAILSVKLRYLHRWNNLRNQHANSYSELLSGLPQLQLPQTGSNCRSVYHLYVIRCERRDDLKKYLKSKHIETGIHYPLPLHLQPAYAYLGYKKGDLPITEMVSESILSLPLYPELTESQIQYVCSCIKDFYQHF